jgi:conjugal transfer mating pair stabilization protein TraG
MEMFAFGNVDELVAVFNAVVLITGSNDLIGLIRSLALVGLIITGLAAAMMLQRWDSITTWFIALAMIFTGLLVPKRDLLITDLTGLQPSAVVNNVPLGLAFFASTTSRAGKWMTQVTETAFSLPTDLKFQENGLMFGASLLQKARSSSVVSAEFKTDLIFYIRNCVNPDVLDGVKTVSSIRNAVDVWSAIGNTNPGRFTTINAAPLHCIDAYQALTAQWAVHQQANQERIGRLSHLKVNSNAAASALIGSQLPDAYSTLLGVSVGSADALRQQMMINVFDDAQIVIPQMMGDPTASQIAVAKAQAEAQAAVQYGVQGKLAEELLPRIRNLIELVAIGAFPFSIIFAVLVGFKGFLVLKNYAMILVWLQMWAPLYAILNFIGTNSTAAKVKASLGGLNGVTLSNVELIQTSVIESQSIVGAMTWAIPVIAWALVKTGEVVGGSIAAQVAAPAGSATGPAASEASKGNQNMGNTSMNNSAFNSNSANKFNTDIESMSGNFISRLSGGVGIQSWSGTGAGSAVSIPKNDPGAMGAMLSTSASQAYSRKAAEQQSLATRDETAGARETASALTHAISTQRSRATRQELSKSVGQDQAAGVASNLQTTNAVLDQISEATGASREAAAKVLVAATANANLGKSAKAQTGKEAGTKKDDGTQDKWPRESSVSGSLGTAIGGQINQTYGAKAAATFNAATNSTNQKAWGQVAEHVQRMSSSEAYRSAVASEQTDSSAVTSQLSKGQRLTEQAGVRRENAKSLAQDATNASSGSATASIAPLLLPQNSGMLAGLNREVNERMAKGDVDGAISAIDSRLMHIGQGATPTPKPVEAPSKVPDGARAPSRSSLDANYSGHANAIKSTSNPERKSKSKAGKSSQNIQPVEMPLSMQSASRDIESAGASLKSGFESQKNANQQTKERVKDDIGVSRTADGRTVFNEQLADTAVRNAGTDMLLGAINSTTPLARAADAVGEKVGSGPVGSKAQDAAVKVLGVDPKQVRRKDGYNPKK